jgi:hypothetical protein
MKNNLATVTQLLKCSPPVEKQLKEMTQTKTEGAGFNQQQSF